LLTVLVVPLDKLNCSINDRLPFGPIVVPCSTANQYIDATIQSFGSPTGLAIAAVIVAAYTLRVLFKKNPDR
jgi:hypothetical protein